MIHAASGPSTTSAQQQHPQQGDFPKAYGSQIVPFHQDQTVNDMTAALSILNVSNTSAVSSNAAIPTVSVEKNALMCRWCERCKSGIAYYKDSFICMECKFWLCRSCRNVHTTLHSQRIRVEMRQWINFSSEYRPISNCSKCSTIQRARLQCRSMGCSYSLCVGCFHNSVSLDKFLEEHLEKSPTHQEFFAIYPEEWSVAEERKSCVCSKEGTADPNHPVWVSHCEKCHARMEIGCNVYWCRDCRGAWGFTQWMCEPCFLDTSEDHVNHKQKHYFVKALIREDHNLPDSHKERFYCPICQHWLSETDYVSHKHATGEYSDALSVQRNPDLYWVLSPRRRDWHLLNMYRNCDKELVAKNSVQDPDELFPFFFLFSIDTDELVGNTLLSKCMRCQFLLAYNQSATICIKGNCNHFIYCASCTDGRRIIHRHKESTYIVKLQRKASLPVAIVQCAKCRKSWFKPHFIGIFCGHCKYFAICWTCIGAASKGASFELAGGLPHPITPNNSSSNKCPASDWILIYEPVQTVIGA